MIRCRIADVGSVRAVVIKAAHGPKDLLANEAAGLRLLGSDHRTQAMAPRLLVYDTEARLMIMEGVPPSKSLAELLDGDNRAKAMEALMATARELGRLHGYTSQREERHVSTLPAEQAASFRQNEPVLRAFFERAGVTLSSEALVQLGTVADSLARPQARLAFTVGDMAPSNVLIAAGGPVFIDLEYAGFRHAFHDAVFWRCICPLPAAVATQLDDSYRLGCREAGMNLSAAEFIEAMTLLAAHRALWSLSWGAAALWESDRDWAPKAGGRALVRRWLRGFHAMARQGKIIRELARATEELDEALGRAWPETNGPVSLFPALGATA